MCAFFQRMLRWPGWLGLFVCLTANAASFSVRLDDLVSPSFSARGIAVDLPVDGSADLRVASLKVRQYEFSTVHVHCAEFTLSSSRISCLRAKLDALPDMTLAFVYRFDSGALQLSLEAENGESWQVDGHWGKRAWRMSARVSRAQVRRLLPLLPADMPLPTRGVLDGALNLSGGVSGVEKVSAELAIGDVGFSDASGLHAAEKLRGVVKFSASRKAALWRWRSEVVWQSGEMFWQPLYLQGGHRLAADGEFDGVLLTVGSASAGIPGVGEVRFSAALDVKQKQLRAIKLHGDHLELEQLFADYVRPFLNKGALAASTLYGRADVDWQYHDGETQSVHLRLRDAGIADTRRRFALLGVNGDIDWHANEPRSAEISFAGGALLGAPLGRGKWNVEMRGLEFKVRQANLPVLDGSLALSDFALRRRDDRWRWEFSAALMPISLEEFSVMAGWRKMHGTLAGNIPRVSYDGSEITVDGLLLFNVFDGSVAVNQLKLGDAFGRAPRLSASVTMRNLDMDLLTRTFSFGNIQGRIDVDVDDLVLQDWQPTRFSARVFSSAGNYPKKISQKAVQNISALGGAGAAAAIQRSYLRFFENFRYSRIAWGCELRDGICTMSGLAGGDGTVYTIVAGGGIPAISVMGYNRAVSWQELITRLQRVTQSNVKPIIK